MAGTAVASNKGFIAWEAEDSFADAADDTITTRFVARDDVLDVSNLTHDFVSPGGVYQRYGEQDAMRLGAYGVKTFSFTQELQGHGSTTAGALTATNQLNLLAHVVGNVDSSQVGGALTTGTNDANTLTSTNTTLLTGGLIRVGAKGDTRADGQGSVLADATSPYELNVDLPASPTTADSVKAMMMVYPVSTSGSGDIFTSNASASNNTLRFLIATENLVWAARGCVCTGLTLNNAGPGGMPTLTFTFSCVFAEPVASITVPNTANATDDKTSAGPNTTGSLFINNVTSAGVFTTTRVTDLPLEVSVDLGILAVALPGPGGENTAQSHVGWRRVDAPATISLTFEAEAQTATPTYYHSTDPTQAKHILYTASTVDGSSWALYAPYCFQQQNTTYGSTNGINTVTVTYDMTTSPVTTNELTLSRWRIGLG